MAEIHGTEEDRVNCPFFFKIGACRHGERCSRTHHRPAFSQTVLVPHMWQNPVATLTAAGGDSATIDKEKAQDDFEEFYEVRRCGRGVLVRACEGLGGLCVRVVGGGLRR